MARLGKSPWDSAGYAVADIIPNYDNTWSLGTPTNRFKNIYLSEDIVMDDLTLSGDLTFSGTSGLIRTDTVDSADNKSISITAAGSVGSTRGAYAVLYGNEHATNPGEIEIATGGVAGADISLSALSATSVIRIFTGGSIQRWVFDELGNLRGDSSLHGDFKMPKEGASILLGTGALLTGLTASPFQSVNDGQALNSSTMLAYGNAANAPAVVSLAKTRGASGSSNTLVQTGDALGLIKAQGANGTAYNNAAAIEFRAGATPTANTDVPGRIVFMTTPDGSTTLTDRWVVNESGNLVQDSTGGGDIVFNKATSNIQLLSGANGRTGTFTLNGATPVVVSNTSLAAGDQIIITRDTPAGTPGAFNLTARSNGASFTVTGTALDTSGMRYTLIRIN